MSKPKTRKVKVQIGMYDRARIEVIETDDQPIKGNNVLLQELYKRGEIVIQLEVLQEEVK